MTLLFQAVVQDGVGLAARAERLTRQERSHMIEGVPLFAAKGIVEIKCEIASLRVGPLIKQQHLTARQK